MINQCLASCPCSLDHIHDTGGESCEICMSAIVRDTEQNLGVEPTCLLEQLNDSVHGQWDFLARFQHDGVARDECDWEGPHGDHEREVEWNLQWV